MLMQKCKKLITVIGILLLITVLVSCDTTVSEPVTVSIKTYDRTTLAVGKTLQLELTDPDLSATWSASNDAVTVDQNGLVTAVREGKVAVTTTCGEASDSVMIQVVAAPVTPDDGAGDNDDGAGDNGGGAGNGDNDDPAAHAPATSLAEALERSQKGILSGMLTVPDQAPTLSAYRPMQNGQYILNDQPYFADNNTYVVVDAYGQEVFRVYRGGGYITLEEVAAYVYAFGDVPANYVSSKNMEPENSIWGQYLRLNHTRFSGDTDRYPYEPRLPNISGCGGALYYYEIDIGTTGTDCDPAYISKIYNDGQTITRGAARIVYGKYDLDSDGVYEFGEHHLFYTYNHYNDFQEYLNYYGGWGQMFGNITGGGSISSKSDYNPTPYVAVVRAQLPDGVQAAAIFYDPKHYLLAAA